MRNVINGIHVTPGFQRDHNLIGISDAHGECSNCHGTGFIVSTAILSGPHEHQPLSGRGRAAIWGRGGWYVGESKTTPCPICNGNKDELVRLLLDHCGVPVPDRHKTLEYHDPDSDVVEVLGPIIARLPECKGFVTLFGRHATGKTTAAQIVVLHACRAGVNSMYTTAREVVRGIKDTWSKPDVSENDYIQTLTVPKLLVIDEIDTIGGNDIAHLRSVIDMRYRMIETTMTIMVTNEDLTRPAREEYIRTRMNAGVRVML